MEARFGPSPPLEPRQPREGPLGQSPRNPRFWPNLEVQISTKISDLGRMTRTFLTKMINFGYDPKLIIFDQKGQKSSSHSAKI